MKTNVKSVVNEFQKLYLPKKEERTHNYTVLSVGEATGIKSITEKDGVSYVVSNVMVMIMNHKGTEVLKLSNLSIPMEYVSTRICSTSKLRKARPGEIKSRVYSSTPHFYRIPCFERICEHLVNNQGIASDSRFCFSEGSYRRDGSYYNKVIRIDIKLSEIGERIFLIDDFLSDL